MGRVRKVPPRLTPDLWNELVDDYVSQTEKGYKQTIPTQLPCSYVIWNDNGTIRARNGLTGKIDFQGTDASTVIQSALNSLTSGRTWKEKVSLKGDFTVSDTVTVPSYTILEINGKLTLADNTNKNILKLEANGDYIDIVNGIFDGNKANNTDQGVDGEQTGIYGTGILNFSIVEVTIQNCVREGLYLSASSWGMIRNVYAWKNDMTGIEIDACNYITCVQPEANDNGRYGIDTVGGATLIEKHVTILGGASYGNSGYGLRIKNLMGGEIFGLHVRDNGDGGTYKHNIFIDACENVELIGVESNEANEYGLYIYKSDRINVIGGHYFNNSQASPGLREGIRLYDAKYCKVIACILDDTQVSPTQTKGILEDGTTMDYNQIIYCDVSGLTSTKISTSGVNTIVKHNIGFVTENSGTKTIASGETIITNMDITPTWASIEAIGTIPVSISHELSGNNIIVYHDQPGSISVRWRCGV